MTSRTASDLLNVATLALFVALVLFNVARAMADALAPVFA